MVTMADVARLSGTSVSTVSHVINGTRPVSGDLRSRVEAAVVSSGYHPNQVARALATANTDLIGVVMSAMSNPMFGEVVTAMEITARRLGLTLVVTDSRGDAALEAKAVRVMLDRRVEGIILAAAGPASSETLDLLHRRRTPTVLIDRLVDERFDLVAAESVESTAGLVTHLEQHGHRSIAFIAGLAGLSTTADRLTGYRLGLRRAGLRYQRALVRPGRSTVAGGYAATVALLESPKRPSAIVSANNNMTVGVYRAVRRLGLRIPEDLALVSFDDIECADLFAPSLTAAAQPIRAMGESAIELLVRRIAAHHGERACVRLSTTFVRRESCGCPPERERLSATA